MSPRARILVGFLLANVALLTVAGLLYLNRPATPPLIQGVLLPEGRALPPFSLLDHHNQVFTNSDLLGRWHIVAYGFTSCPDICPSALAQLAVVARRLEEQDRDDQDILFYSVDHRRDTVSQMASYVPFFHPRFTGLTHSDEASGGHLAFEQGLGMISQLLPATADEIAAGAEPYEVSHGVTLFLINPQGELQAIFEPEETLTGIYSFSPETVLRDYLAIRDFLG